MSRETFSFIVSLCDDTLQWLGILNVSEQFYASTTAESRAKIWYQLNAFKPPVSLAAVCSKGGDSLLIVPPIVGFCNCTIFCYALFCGHSSFAIISMGNKELVALLCLSSWCLVIVV